MWAAGRKSRHHAILAHAKHHRRDDAGWEENVDGILKDYMKHQAGWSVNIGQKSRTLLCNFSKHGF